MNEPITLIQAIVLAGLCLFIIWVYITIKNEEKKLFGGTEK